MENQQHKPRPSKPQKVHALGLCSGGLDSMLSAMVLREQGVSVEWIAFETPFFSSTRAERAARMLNIPLTVQDITPPYLKMLKNPNCGYGKYMNPCMDCHTLMFRKAGEHMAEKGYAFLFSGEVLGQRPMSQTRTSLRYVEKHSGHEGYILRPLSAKRLPETIPEKQGLVDRDRLLDIAGRSRKKQIQLAKAFGITDYPAPAGGCLLTDKGYSVRLRDLLDRDYRFSPRDLHLLRHGRHFRLDDRTKAVVGRTEQDNREIRRLADTRRDTILTAADFPGPVALVPWSTNRRAVLQAAGICAGYTKAPRSKPAKVDVFFPSGRETVEVLPMPPGEARRYLI